MWAGRVIVTESSQCVTERRVRQSGNSDRNFMNVFVRCGNPVNDTVTGPAARSSF